MDCFIPLLKVRMSGLYEIDLLAIEACPGGRVRRYHIASGVFISGAYFKLTAEEFSPDRLKVRVEQASQRRTQGSFIHRKFGHSEVIPKLKQNCYEDCNCTKIVVTWGWTEEAKAGAEETGIVLWDFPYILQ
jgi:hypothetical protein